MFYILFIVHVDDSNNFVLWYINQFCICKDLKMNTYVNDTVNVNKPVRVVNVCIINKINFRLNILFHIQNFNCVNYNCKLLLVFNKPLHFEFSQKIIFAQQEKSHFVHKWRRFFFLSKCYEGGHIFLSLMGRRPIQTFDCLWNKHIQTLTTTKRQSMKIC